MMVFTHVAAGLVVAAAVATVTPEYAISAAAGAAAGGTVPDLDLFVGTHRRTLHFPELYWLPAALFGALAAVRPSPLAVALAVGFVAAAVHSVSDWFGAGDELRPWERTSSHAVYRHVRGRWLAPRYWVRYDGAPEDVLAAAVLSVPALVVYDGPVRLGVVAMLVLGVVYALLRKRIVPFAERLLT